MTRHIPLAFPVVVGVTGIILIAVSLANLRKARSTSGWPSVAGKILRAQIVPVEQLREKKQKLVLFRPDLAYGYTVNGSNYVANTIRMDLEGQPTTAEAERMLEIYPVGRGVTVYYNPADPAEAVLEPGRDPQTKSLLGCGIVLFIVSLAMLGFRYFGQPPAPFPETGNGSPSA